MNGAESLLRTLVRSDVEICFGNPGTSEMHFVAALDRVEGMRVVLGLFEGAVTGMADGYGRMAEKPAATLLHLGPGLANGLANLHNARRAATPIVNIVGDHATYHAQYDAPLASDVHGFAGLAEADAGRGFRRGDGPSRCRARIGPENHDADPRSRTEGTRTQCSWPRRRGDRRADRLRHLRPALPARRRARAGRTHSLFR